MSVQVRFGSTRAICAANASGVLPSEVRAMAASLLLMRSRCASRRLTLIRTLINRLGASAKRSREKSLAKGEVELKPRTGPMQLVPVAEAADHHPDVTIRYRRVTVSFTTHSEGGITEKDVEGARGLAEG